LFLNCQPSHEQNAYGRDLVRNHVYSAFHREHGPEHSQQYRTG
jgi:hypothetical protein